MAIDRPSRKYSDSKPKPRRPSSDAPRFPRRDDAPRADRDSNDSSKPRRDYRDSPRTPQRDSHNPKPRRDSARPQREGGFGGPRRERAEERSDRPHRRAPSETKDFRSKEVRSVWDDPHELPEAPRRERKIPEGADRLDEIKACGVNACRAIFKARPNDLVRAYVTEELIKEFGDLLKFCSTNKKAYHVVRADELNKISGSTHHEGVCVIAKVKPAQTWEALKAKLSESKTKPTLLLILEDVGNPHNVGAMLRTAAHFGVAGVLAPNQDTFKPSPALLRTAEGGYETVGVTTSPKLSDLVAELKKLGFEVIATAANAKATIYDEEALSPRVAFIVGNESRGISADARKLAHSTLSIPGTGAVESLNVSAATASLCSEFWRAHRS